MVTFNTSSLFISSISSSRSDSPCLGKLFGLLFLPLSVSLSTHRLLGDWASSLGRLLLLLDEIDSTSTWRIIALLDRRLLREASVEVGKVLSSFHCRWDFNIADFTSSVMKQYTTETTKPCKIITLDLHILL